MDIAIHTPHIDANDDDLSAQVEKGLARFAERLTRVEVFVKDVNASKGGVDKHCAIESRPRGLDPVAVDHNAENVHDAVHGAVGKMQRALETRFGKLGEVH